MCKRISAVYKVDGRTVAEYYSFLPVSYIIHGSGIIQRVINVCLAISQDGEHLYTSLCEDRCRLL
jgi:hypothetical protein